MCPESKYKLPPEYSTCTVCCSFSIEQVKPSLHAMSKSGLLPISLYFICTEKEQTNNQQQTTKTTNRKETCSDKA